MKLITPLILLGFAAPLMAGNLNVSITPYQKAAGFLQDRNFRFLQTESLVTPNAATHILIAGLLPASTTNANLVSSAYTAINIDSGVEQDAGYVTLELPSTTPEAGVVTSPIVGIVQRTGAWSSLSLTPVASNIGDSTGASSYDPTNKSITFALTRTVNSASQTITGTAAYTITDANTITLAPFTLTVNAATFSFGSTTLARTGNTFTGELPATLTAETFDPDSAVYMLNFVDGTDADGDNLPDLVDTDIVPQAKFFGSETGDNQFVDLGGNFLWANGIDYIYDGFFPFVYVYSSSNWIYVFTDGGVTEASGYYVFDFGRGQFGYTGHAFYPWYLVVPQVADAVYVNWGAAL